MKTNFLLRCVALGQGFKLKEARFNYEEEVFEHLRSG